MLGLKTMTLGPKLGAVFCAMAAVLRVATVRRTLPRTRASAGIALRGFAALDLTKVDSAKPRIFTAPIKLSAPNGGCQGSLINVTLEVPWTGPALWTGVSSGIR